MSDWLVLALILLLCGMCGVCEYSRLKVMQARREAVRLACEVRALQAAVAKLGWRSQLTWRETTLELDMTYVEELAEEALAVAPASKVVN